MEDLTAAFGTAFRLMSELDANLVEIVGLSLRVSLSAVGLAALIGLPLGAAVALAPFSGRRAVAVLLNALMGLPPVVMGLIVYLLLSRAGPLGTLGLLFTPGAMIIAQFLLVTPIIAALTRQVVEDLWGDRFSLVTAVLAGFGRASAEVGAVMIVGGNIDHLTRVMTTAIALETSRGDLALALGLGIVLMTLSLAINAAAFLLREWGAGGAPRLARS
jgi:tungstate transport system permease protein